MSETSLSHSIAPEKAETKGSGDVEVDIERTATAGTTHNGSSSDFSAVGSAGYHRSLTRRKVMMMTFGAGIGTGLWVGTGQALLYGKLKPWNTSTLQVMMELPWGATKLS
jgi:amino acid transporter